MKVALQTKVFSQSGFLLAEDLGYFEDEGLKVETTVSEQAAGTLLAGLASGSFDVVFASTEAVQAFQQGADIIAIGAHTNAPAWSIVSRPGLTSVDSLNGATVATSGPDSIATAAFHLWATASGIDIAKLNEITIGSTSARLSAVLAGTVDATVVFTPQNFVATDRGLVDLGSVSTKVPEFVTGVVSAGRRWAESNPDTVTKFLRAYVKGITYLYDPANKADVTQRLTNLLEVDQNVAERLYSYWVEQGAPGAGLAIPIDGKVDMKGLGISAQALVDVGSMQSVPDLTKFVPEQYRR